jgi:hypothetical protein
VNKLDSAIEFISYYGESFLYVGTQTEQKVHSIWYETNKVNKRNVYIQGFKNGQQALANLSLANRDQCYDFLNIFDEKFSENIGVFCSNYC